MGRQLHRAAFSFEINWSLYYISFSMLTVNADEHRVMKRFHKAGDESALQSSSLSQSTKIG